MKGEILSLETAEKLARIDTTLKYVDKLYFHLKFCIETIKELKGSDKE